MGEFRRPFERVWRQPWDSRHVGYPHGRATCDGPQSRPLLLLPIATASCPLSGRDRAQGGVCGCLPPCMPRAANFQPLSARPFPCVWYHALCVLGGCFQLFFCTGYCARFVSFQSGDIFRPAIQWFLFCTLKMYFQGIKMRRDSNSYAEKVCLSYQTIVCKQRSMMKCHEYRQVCRRNNNNYINVIQYLSNTWERTFFQKLLPFLCKVRNYYFFFVR